MKLVTSEQFSNYIGKIKLSKQQNPEWQLKRAVTNSAQIKDCYDKIT